MRISKLILIALLCPCLVVVSDDMVTTPLGSMDVLRMDFHRLGGCEPPFGGVVFLDRDHGLVMTSDLTLVALDGMTPTEQRSWSGVESMFVDETAASRNGCTTVASL